MSFNDYVLMSLPLVASLVVVAMVWINANAAVRRSNQLYAPIYTANAATDAAAAAEAAEERTELRRLLREFATQPPTASSANTPSPVTHPVSSSSYGTALNEAVKGMHGLTIMGVERSPLDPSAVTNVTVPKGQTAWGPYREKPTTIVSKAYPLGSGMLRASVTDVIATYGDHDGDAPVSLTKLGSQTVREVADAAIHKGKRRASRNIVTNQRPKEKPTSKP